MDEMEGEGGDERRAAQTPTHEPAAATRAHYVDAPPPPPDVSSTTSTTTAATVPSPPSYTTGSAGWDACHDSAPAPTAALPLPLAVLDSPSTLPHVP